MKEKKFAIIGKPLSHSLSPIMHNYWFDKYKIKARYDLMEINDEDIKKVVDKIKKKELDGINVTLPYKQKIIQYLGKLVNDAKETHSVNTVYLAKNGELVGDNTDVFGMQAAYLSKINFNKLNSSALVLGAGGVAPSIIYALTLSNFSKISISNRTYEKSIFLKKKFPLINIIKWDEYNSPKLNYSLVINATSLGMKNGNKFKNPINNINDESIYIDTIYNPLETEMIKHLKNKNIKTFNGLDMLIYQGQKSFYIWNKVNPEIDDELINLLKDKIK
mgnify:CR=1 FL=1|tara:strand:+ start:15 stop:842 length:828 start_codon:yes stop_codon:yes gene_type:complete